VADDLDPAAVERAAQVLRETYGLFIEQSAEGWESDAREVLAAAAAPTVETTTVWGFESPQPGLYYVTTNDMLIEVMHRARPEVAVLTCEVTPWREVPRG